MPVSGQRHVRVGREEALRAALARRIGHRPSGPSDAPGGSSAGLELARLQRRRYGAHRRFSAQQSPPSNREFGHRAKARLNGLKPCGLFLR